MNTKPNTFLAIAAGALTVLALSGCAAPAADAEAEAEPVASAADAMQITDPWVKATDEGMSATFGVLENTSTEDLTVVSATSPSVTTVELHETVENEAGEMIMRPKAGGFTIPAGATFALEPGANHIMLMGLTEPILAGDELTFTLTFSDDSTLEFTAPAKDYAGANENYEGGDTEMDMGGEHE